MDTGEAEKSLSSAEGKAQGFGAKLGSIAGTAARVGAAVVAGAGVATTALFGLANKAAGATDRVDKLSQKIGISRTGFQEWDYILSQNGASVEGLQMGLKTLSKVADGATKGMGAGAAAFKRLGVEVKDSNGQLKSQEQLFNETFLALSKMENETERTSLASQLLGRSAQELAPTLNSGAESMEELRLRAHELGLVLGDDAIDAGVVFGDTMDDLKKSFGAVATSLGVEVMPMFQSLADWVLSHMPTIQAVISRVFDFVAVLVRGFIDGVKWIISTVQEWVQSNDETVTMIGDKFAMFFDTAKELFAAFVTFVTMIWDKWGADILEVVEILWKSVQGVFGGAFEILMGLMETFIGIFTGDWGRAWEGITRTFGGAWDAMKSIATGAINLIIKAVNLLIRGLNMIKFDVPSWVPIIGGKSWGFNLSEIGLLGQDSKSATSMANMMGNVARMARGGTVMGAGAALVGEEGPELLNLPRGATVTPLGGGAGGITLHLHDAMIMDDYGVDRMMDRIVDRMRRLGVRDA